MGGPSRITNNELLDILLPEIRKTSEKQDRMSERLAVFEERQGKILLSIQKLEEAIYGNGKPGLQADVDNLNNRLSDIENTCKLEQDADILDRLEIIEEQHEREAEAREHAIKAQIEVAKEWRKFRYGIFATAITVLLDIALHIFGVK